MSQCLFYDGITGEITGGGVLSESAIAASEKAGVQMLIGQAGAPETHYVNVSVSPVALIAFTDAERGARATMPAGWTFKMPERVAVDLRPLALARIAKSAEITAAWVRADKISFRHQNIEFRAEPDDITRILATNGNIALTGAMPDDWLGVWKAMNNSYFPVPDVDTWTLFYKSFVNQGLNNFKHAQNLKAQIAVADLAQLATINWASPDIEV